MKRFTDTEKWKKKWFRQLPAKQKLLWMYMTDQCDPAGVWDIDFDLAAFYIGEEISEADMEPFGDRVKRISENKYWMTTYIDFQYGSLSRNTPAHGPALRSIEKHNINYTEAPKLIISAHDIFRELVASDEAWVENQLMGFRLTMDQFKKLFKQCYDYHSESDRPPTMIWQWKQKLITWLSINEKSDSKPNSNGKRETKQQQTTKRLGADFVKRNSNIIKGKSGPRTEPGDSKGDK